VKGATEEEMEIDPFSVLSLVVYLFSFIFACFQRFERVLQIYKYVPFPLWFVLYPLKGFMPASIIAFLLFTVAVINIIVVCLRFGQKIARSFIIFSNIVLIPVGLGFLIMGETLAFLAGIGLWFAEGVSTFGDYMVNVFPWFVLFALLFGLACYIGMWVSYWIRERFGGH
jgi:hypothetical protein